MIMRFDTSDIAHALETISVCTEPIDPDILPPIVFVGERVIPSPRIRLRTAVGTTPPVLREPATSDDTSDGVPIETDDDTWLDRIEL